MFNAETKQDYIVLNPNNNVHFERVMHNYFDRVEDTEKRFGKDLGAFTVSEIIAMYKSLCTPSLDMLNVINNQFLNYTNWYMRNVENKDNQNHYREISTDVLLSCISYAGFNSNILTRDELLAIIRDFANPYEQFLYLALFEGIKGEQFSDFDDLKLTDFNKKQKVVQLSNRTVPVSSELIHYAEDAATEYQMYNINGEPVRRGKLLATDDRIIKCPDEVGMETERSDRIRLIYRIIRKTKRYDFVPTTISITSLIESGRINWVRERMKEKEMSAEEVLRGCKEEMENIYGVVVSIPKWLKMYEEFCNR